MTKQDKKFSLDCNYYNRSFDTIDELIEDIQTSGMDANYEITRNGYGTGENAIDLLTF